MAGDLQGLDPTQFISLWDYFREVFVPMHRLDLPVKPLHRGVCEALQRAFFGELQKSFILVNIPPRVGKTKMMEAFATWALAFFPDSQFIYTSYSSNLVKDSTRYIQKTLTAPWYKDLFQTRIGDVQMADDFNTIQGGRIVGEGVGGSLTGKGGGLKRAAGGAIIIDDPAKPDEALSRVEGDKLRFWFENTLKSRRNSSQWTPIIVCAQRLAVDDLPGYIMETYPDDYYLIKFPALVRGESSIPETVSTKSLLQTQAANPFAFSAQYQQEPIMQGGNLIQLSNFRYYDTDSPPRYELKVITCDTATKAKEHNDFSVAQCWGRSQHRAYLIDQIRGRWEPGQLLKNLAQFYRKHSTSGQPVAYVLIEEAQAGYALIQEVRKKGIPAKGVVRISDKVSRVEAVLHFQETGMVYLPKEAPWLPEFELEIASFRRDGKSKHDDMVDAMSDGLRVALGKGTSILSVLGGNKKRF